MSLKYFHLLFITFSVLLAFLCAALEYANYRQFGGTHLAFAISAAVAGIGLIFYGFWFFKKAKRIIL